MQEPGGLSIKRMLIVQERRNTWPHHRVDADIGAKRSVHVIVQAG